MPTLTMREESRLFSDTVTFSNFTVAGRMDVLLTHYGERAHVTQEVLDEIGDGIAAGYTGLSAAEEAVTRGRLTAADALAADERAEYRSLLRSLGPGEGSCIACARSRGGTVVADDRAARGLCRDRGVPFTGTIGLLKACCSGGPLSPEDADAALQAMVDAGLHSPVGPVSDLL